jgi:hypothetical protein
MLTGHQNGVAGFSGLPDHLLSNSGAIRVTHRSPGLSCPGFYGPQSDAWGMVSKGAKKRPPRTLRISQGETSQFRKT